MMRFERQSNGQGITLDAAALLGRGGEAVVFAAPPGGSLVAKVYHEPTEEYARKLAVMLANPPDDPMAAQGQLSIAWPIDLLRDAEGRRGIVGYLMPRASGVRPLFTFYNPSTRRRQCPLSNYFYLHRTARNLAAAVRALHARGYVIGDINESNILVTETALVTLVDTDSFQVRDSRSGTVFRCPVGKPEFTPPELQGKPFANIDRRPEHDLFGLAVLIFQLLMEGTHPFAGLYQGYGDPPPYEARIRGGHFPYGARYVPYRPMPSAPPFTILHPALRQLFVHCFEDGQANPQARPDAQTWQSVLADAEAALVRCSVNGQHRYGNHLAACPWCERSAQLRGRDPFPSLQAVQQGQHLQPLARPRPLSPASGRRAAPATSLSGSALTLPMPAPFGSGTTLTAPALPESGWTWGALVLALLAFVPGLSLWAGLAALVCGVLGWRALYPIAGYGKWMAILSGSFGGLIALLMSFLPSIQPQQAAGVWTLSTGGGGIRTVAFSPDGRTLVSGSERAIADRLGGEIALWDPQERALKQTLPGMYSGDVVALAFSPDGKTLAAASGGPMEPGVVKLWDMSNQLVRQTLRGRRGYVNAVAFAPDGKTLASGGQDGTVRLWDPETGALKQAFSERSEVCAVAFSPNGKTLAVGRGGPNASTPGSLLLRDIATGSLLWRQTAHSTSVLSVAFSPDGRTVASSGNDNAVRLWDAHTGAVKRTLEGHGFWISAVAFSRDGNTLASGGSDNTVGLWDVRTGALKRPLTGHSGEVNALAFAPDGRTLASGSKDGTIKLWSVP